MKALPSCHWLGSIAPLYQVMPTLLPDVACTEAFVGPDVLARPEVDVPARLL